MNPGNGSFPIIHPGIPPCWTNKGKVRSRVNRRGMIRTTVEGTARVQPYPYHSSSSNNNHNRRGGRHNILFCLACPLGQEDRPRLLQSLRRHERRSSPRWTSCLAISETFLLPPQRRRRRPLRPPSPGIDPHRQEHRPPRRPHPPLPYRRPPKPRRNPPNRPRPACLTWISDHPRRRARVVRQPRRVIETSCRSFPQRRRMRERVHRG